MLGLVAMNFAPVADGAVAFRYFRFNCISGTGSNFRINEASISNDGGTTLYPQSIGNMTGPSAPSPLVATASSSPSSGRPPWEAFDGTDSGANSWQASTASNEWLQIDLGAGNEIIANYITLSFRQSSEEVAQGELLGSNTGSFSGEETVLHSWSGHVGLIYTASF